MLTKALKYKCISLVLVMILACSIITGCDSEDTEGDFIKKNIVDNSKYRTVTICFQGKKNDRSEPVMEEIEARLKSTLKIDLNFKWLGGGYGESYLKKIEEMIASGQEIDAFFAKYPSTNEYILEFQRKGLLKDISEELRLYAPKIYLRMDSETMNDASCGGALVSIPSFVPSTTRLGVVVRQDLMNKYGIEEMENFEDYESFMKIVKEKEEDIIPGCINSGVYTLLYPTDLEIFYEPFLAYRRSDPDTKLIPLEQTSEFSSAVQLAKKWYDAGYTKSGDILRQGWGFDGMLSAGELASVLTGWNRACSWARERGSTYKLRAYPLYMDRPAQKGTGYSESLVFTKNIKNHELVLKFIEWAHSSQENYDLLMYGIDGYDYWIKDGKVTHPKSKTWHYSNWFGSSAFEDIEYMRPFGTDQIDFKEYYRHVIEYNTEYPITYGFTPDSSKYKDIVKKRQDKFLKLMDDVFYETFKMSLGDFIGGQKKDGADELTKKIQIQLDEWKKNKKG